MNNISFHHWGLAFLGALFCHAAVAFGWGAEEPVKMERSAGAPVQIVGSLSQFSNTQAIEETVEEIIEPIEDVKTPELVEPLDTPETDEIAVKKQEVKKKNKQKKLVKKVKKQKKKAKKAKKTKKEQRKKRASQRVAALQKGGGAKGRRKAAGRAAMANYKGRVLSHLSRFKRSPPSNKRAITRVRFTISRSGRVTSVRLVRGSGVSIYDKDSVAMVRRASPFPAPPPGSPRVMTFTVPVHYR